MSTTIPVEFPAASTGAAAPEQRKFQRLTDRVVFRQEGEKGLHYIAVLVASAVFLPLIVLADGVRYGGFKLGERNATVAKYFNGQSWSLVDKVSAGCKVVVEKTTAAWKQLKGNVVSKYKELTTKKSETLDELNAKSEKAIQEHVAQLIKGYRAHNNGGFVTDKADEMIARAQGGLWRLVLERVKDNAQGSGDFAKQFGAAQKLVETAIEEQAKGKFYVPDHVHRRGALPPLARQVIFEFKEFANGQKGDLAKLALEKNRQDTDPVAGLAQLVSGKIITKKQAAEAFKERANTLYATKLQSGLTGAEATLNTLLDSAVSRGIVSADEGKRINQSIQPDVGALARAAADELVGAIDDDAVVRNGLSEMVGQLTANGRLRGGQVTDFTTKAQGLLTSMKAQIEQERQEAARKAEFEAARAAEIAALPGQFQEALAFISGKQKELGQCFEAFKALNEQMGAIQQEVALLENSKVKITLEGKEEWFTVREASQRYGEALKRVAGGKAENPAKVNTAAQNLGASYAPLVPHTSQLAAINTRLSVVTAERAALAETIKLLFKEIGQDKMTVRLFYASVKKEIGDMSVIDHRLGEIDGLDGVQYRDNQSIWKDSLLQRWKPRETVRISGTPKVLFQGLLARARAPAAPSLEELTA